MRIKDVSSELNEILNQLQAAEPVLQQVKVLLGHTPLVSRLNNIKPYSQMRTIVTQSFVDWKEALSTPLWGNNNLALAAEASRDIFYQDYFNMSQAYNSQARVSIHLNVADLGDPIDAVAELQVSLEELTLQVHQLMDRLPSDNEDTYLYFNAWFDNLRACGAKFDDPNIRNATTLARNGIQARIKSILEEVTARVKGYPDNEDENDAVTLGQKLADQVIELQIMLMKIPAFTTDLEKAIKNILSFYAENHASIIPVLTNYLLQYPDADKRMFGKMLILSNGVLSGHKHFLFNTASRVAIDESRATDILDTQGPVDKSTLQSQFTLFMSEYREVYRRRMSMPIPEALADILKKVKSIPNGPGTYQQKVRNILAHLFAHWTMQDSEYFRQLYNDPNNRVPLEELEKYLRQPRAAQVLAIFRLLEMDMSEETRTYLYTGKGSISTFIKNKFFKIAKAAVEATGLDRFIDMETPESEEEHLKDLFNHLAEIPTGEGKSVTLAMLAAVFALMGHQVHTGCYSDYLTKRDYDSFKDLFEAIGVADKIHYGTFEQLCEKQINSNFDIRKKILSLFPGQEGYSEDGISKPMDEASIQLLIDEIDKLFNDFYGRQYRPKVVLKDPVVTNLIMMMWKNRNNPDFGKIDYVRSTAEFKACAQLYNGWDELLLEAVKGMKVALSTIAELDKDTVDPKVKDEHKYVLNERGEIGYSRDDGIFYNEVRGYLTLFSYLKENERNPKLVTQDILNQHLGIYLNCGEFSYIEMLLQYLHMRGVTATLNGLSQRMKDILRDKFGFKQTTTLHSVYGDRKQRFDFDHRTNVKIVSDEDYFRELALENERSLYNREGKRKGATLMFFEGSAELEAFYSSKEFSENRNGDIKKKAKTLTAATEEKTRDALVMGAAASGQNTLAESAFARGTDFVCHDMELDKAGGLRLIAGYVPRTRADQCQLEGRTARQGMKGSCCWIVRESELINVFKMSHEQVVHLKTSGYRHAYDEIIAARDRIEDQGLDKGFALAQQNEEAHKQSLEFLTELGNNNLTAIKSFLLKQNKEVNYGGAPGKSCAVIVLDATGSMSQLIKATKDAIKIMYEQGRDILKGAGHDPNLFSIRIAVYRNYNASKPLEYSDLSTNPDTLGTWLDKIAATGGYGGYDAYYEAAELGLKCVNAWTDNPELNNGVPIQNVILMSDVGVHQRELTDKHRAGGIWFTNAEPFLRDPAYVEEEVKKLVLKKIPVHSFYLTSHAQNDLTNISVMTGGKSSSLNVNNSDQAVDQLRTFVTPLVLGGIGGAEGGAELVRAFNAKYVAGYTDHAPSRPAAPTTKMSTYRAPVVAGSSSSSVVGAPIIDKPVRPDVAF